MNTTLKPISCQEIFTKKLNPPQKNSSSKECFVFIDTCKKITFDTVHSHDSIWGSVDKVKKYLYSSHYKIGSLELKVINYLFNYFRYGNPCFSYYKNICSVIGTYKKDFRRAITSLERKNIIKKMNWFDTYNNNKNKRIRNTKRIMIIPISQNNCPHQVINCPHQEGLNGGSLTSKVLKYQEKSKNNIDIINFNIKPFENTKSNFKKHKYNSLFNRRGTTYLFNTFPDRKSICGSFLPLSINEIKPIKYKLKAKEKPSMISKFLVRRKIEENNLKTELSKNIDYLKSKNFDLDELPNNKNKQKIMNSLNYLSKIDFDSFFRYPIKVTSKKVNQQIKILRIMFCEIYTYGYSIDFEFCKKVMEQWNIISTLSPNHKNIIKKIRINEESIAFIQAATAITHAFCFKGFKSFDTINLVLKRISKESFTYKTPFNKLFHNCKKISITEFFSDIWEQGYLNAYFNPDENMFETLTSIYANRKTRDNYPGAYKQFKAWIIDIIFNGKTKEAELPLTRYNNSIKLMVDNLIEKSKMRNMNGLKLYSSTGENQPALLHYYLTFLENETIRNFNRKPMMFEIFEYLNWIKFVNYVVHEELGYYDFWKIKDVQNG